MNKETSLVTIKTSDELQSDWLNFSQTKPFNPIIPVSTHIIYMI